jgi:hypothetical protein
MSGWKERINWKMAMNMTTTARKMRKMKIKGTIILLIFSFAKNNWILT